MPLRVRIWSRRRPMERSREWAQERLPAMVLISPLWAMRRKGWALSQEVRVLVEKRRWNRAKRVAKGGSCRSR